jgi:hypothetical protein
MARRLFKKGEVWNPLGAGAHSKEIKMARRLTRGELADLASMLVKCDVVALRAIAKSAEDPEAKNRPSVLVVAYTAAIIKAINKGSLKEIEIILDRVIGRVKDVVEISGPEGGALAFSNLSPVERNAEIAKLLLLRDQQEGE